MKKFLKVFSYCIGFTALSLIMHVIAMFIFTIAYYVLHMSLHIFSGNTKGIMSIDINMILQDVIMPSYIFSGVLTFLSAWVIHAIFKRKFFDRLSLNKTSHFLIVISFIMGAALQMPISFIMSLLENAGLAPDMFEQYSDSMNALMNNQNIVLLVIEIGIIAPLIEEIIFRGLIFNLLKKNMPVWAALIIQAFLFGLAHLNFIQGSYAFVLGIIMGLALMWSKSIYPPISIHIGMNLSGIILSEYSDVLSDNISIFLLIISFILVPVCGIFIYRKTKENNEIILSVEVDNLKEATEI